jgi:hypothetical protein
MTKAAYLLVLLFAITVSPSAVAQQAVSSDWVPGMFWTYQTDVVERRDGIRTEGSMTFLVLTDAGCMPSDTWYLAVMTQWYDGSEIMITTSHSEALTVVSWRRWPQIVNFVPPKQLPDLLIQFRQSVASSGLPWFCEDTSMSVESRREDGWTESISLADLTPETVQAPAGSFDDAVGIHYSWSGRLNGEELEANEGTAWWSMDVGWWVRAEGLEKIMGYTARTYEIVLSNWGVLSNEDMRLRLANALTSTEAIDPELARGLRIVLDSIGVDVTSN